jgi:mono/diheme cytochrome c family protein
LTDEHVNPESCGSSPVLAGLLAEFAGPEALKEAAERVRDAGYRRWDVHSPFPVHGMDRAMGIRPTILPWLVLGAGISGGAAALLLQWWTNAVAYPYLISGKPLFSLPANIPVTFEVIVLFSALAAFASVLALNALPRYAHPVFSVDRFRRVTTDGFFLSIDASDPKFDETETRLLLASAGATAVEECYEDPAGREIPKAVYGAVAVVAVLALLPPLLIAWYRAVPYKRQPRFRPIQDMVAQPKFKMQAANPFFADGRAMRSPVPGTIAWGRLEADPAYWRGRKSDGGWVAEFPVPVTMEAMRRGQERFNIYCAICHGLAGEGDGMVARRAQKRGEPTWVPPLSLHVDSVREQPVGQLFNTITHGARTMPGYGAQIPVDDRWAIVMYVRALQRSQRASLEDVPEASRLRLSP